MSDEAICETFGWDIYTLYKQPAKRLNEFGIVLDERARIRKEKEAEIERKARSRR